MKHKHHASRPQSRTRHSPEPKLQIICLASGGGPNEDNVTGFLVRSLSTNWAKNSVLAVDAGSHLASITRLLEDDFPLVYDEPHLKSRPLIHRNGSVDTDISSTPFDDDEISLDDGSAAPPTPNVKILETGPFAGLPFPNESARANALHVVRECISTYLITHPHLDHLAGFVTNTAAFHNTSRPKRLAALPSTVNAIKTHIFNDIIWPNLTDEDGGVGFVTFQRLAQGGNIAVGEGYGKGYIEVCDGLCVRGMKVSHGHCTRGHGSDSHRNSEVGLSEATVHVHKGSIHATTQQHGNESPQIRTNSVGRRTPSITQLSMPGTPGLGGIAGLGLTMTTSGTHPAPASDLGSREVVVDSTAYFIRCDVSGRECLIFGDVEPDSLSLHPRNAQVWAEAAPKVASGILRVVLIECSYDDSQNDNILFGHLAPRHVIKELSVLAQMVKQKRLDDRERKEGKKRKRTATWPASEHLQPDMSGPTTEDEGFMTPDSKKRGIGLLGNSHGKGHIHRATTMGVVDAVPPDLSNLLSPKQQAHATFADSSNITPHARHVASQSVEKAASDGIGPLSGLKVVIIHVKDTFTDGPLVGERILEQLEQHEEELKEADGAGLGCEFVISKVGESYWV